MTTSKKILVAAGVILLMSLIQLAVAQQLVSETASETFTARSPILVALSVIQVIFGIWAMAGVGEKAEELPVKPSHKRRKRTK